MLIPINTDAPLYHFPWMTIVLIVVNVVCFVATGFALDDARLEPWLLEYGNGLNPLEWIPAAFAHSGFFHLIGNMFFLWGFGIILEGKLGWFRFLLLYLGLAAAWGFGVDVLTVHRTDAWVLSHEFKVESIDELADQLIAHAEAEDEPLDPELAVLLAQRLVYLAKGRCLGASGVIFGMMAMALVWAPKNNVHIVGWLVFRPISFEVSIMVFSLWYIGVNVVLLMFSGFQMGSSGLHLIGGIIGFAAGTFYLKRGWVDCENWDLFAVIAGTYGRFGDKDWSLGAHGNPNKLYKDIPVPEGAPADSTEPKQVRPSRELKKISALIDHSDFMSASDALLQLRLTNSTALLDHLRLKRFCLGLLKANAYDEAEIALDEFIERFPDDNSWARVRVAQILLAIRCQPSAARRMLKQVRKSQLDEQLLAVAQGVAATAKQQIATGVQDAEPEW
jgi:membrane associated rhomboid family serine protease